MTTENESDIKPLKILNLDNQVFIDLELHTITVYDESWTVNFKTGIKIE